ncbi:MAG: alkaline phosphatase family protein, partial [Anaerolineales bacterium]|nr:alkaline phosphatase family protein [Anaerolineales bacterium]
MNKVLLIGLDGATFDVIRPLAEAGRLPHLNRLLHEGAWGTLNSTIPPISPTAWTTITTGKNPGQHGVYDFRKFAQVGVSDIDYQRLKNKHKRIWDLLGEAGLRSIVIDVPFTFPPTPLNGVMLTGYGTPRTPDTIFTYPSDLIERVPQALRPEIRVGIPTER